MSQYFILGAGAWGLALGIQLCQNHDSVSIYCLDEALYHKAKQERVHSSLPGVRLPDNLHLTNNLEGIREAKNIVLAVPSGAAEEVMHGLKHFSLSSASNLIIATKGLGRKGELMSSVAERDLKLQVAILAGPNLALEVALGVPSTTMIGSANAHVAQGIANDFCTSTLKALPTAGFRELQIAGCVKNVAAIIAGMFTGLGLGQNSKAWIFSKAMQDVVTLSSALGGVSLNDIVSPGVAGDLAMCFYSQNSRNNSFGNALVHTKPSERRHFIDSYAQLVEGKENVGPLQKLSKHLNVKVALGSLMAKVLEDPAQIESTIEALLS